MLISILLVFLPLAAVGAQLGSTAVLWAALLGFMAMRCLTLGWETSRLPAFASAAPEKG